MNDEMIKELWEAIDDSATARKLEAKINRLLIEASLGSLQRVERESDYDPDKIGNVLEKEIAELKRQLEDKR